MKTTEQKVMAVVEAFGVPYFQRPVDSVGCILVAMAARGIFPVVRHLRERWFVEGYYPGRHGTPIATHDERLETAVLEAAYRATELMERENGVSVV